jgi:hypothetical protein
MGQLLRVVQRAGERNLVRVEECLAREKDSGVALSEEEWSGEYGACCDATPSLDWPAERLDGSRSERQTSTLKGKKQMHNTRNTYEPSQSSIA